MTNITQFKPVSTVSPSATLLSTDAFTLVELKKGGVSSGGVYQDKRGHKWLLKEGQWGNIKNGINEYLAGGVFQHILGAYAPQTELVFDNARGEILVGSKFLEHFQTLAKFNPGRSSTPEYLKKSSQGKVIKNYTNVLASVIFTNDTDAHDGNLGVVEEDNAWVVCKIDHGYAFQPTHTDTTLASFKLNMLWVATDGIKQLGFDNLYQSIKMIANINYDEIEAIVNSKAQNAQGYLDAYTVHYGTEPKMNLEDLRKNILTLMKKQIEDFKKIKRFMSLEKAIRSDDLDKVKRLVSKGVDCKSTFDLFNPIDDCSSRKKEKADAQTLALYYQSKKVSQYLNTLLAPQLIPLHAARPLVFSKPVAKAPLVVDRVSKAIEAPKPNSYVRMRAA